MAKIGLSKPYFAKYDYSGNKVTYTGAALMGKAVELSIELEGADDNILYADNGPAESANTFAGGTYKITTDELLPETMIDVLGVTEEAIESDAITTADPKWYKFNDRQRLIWVLVRLLKFRRIRKSNIRQLFCRKHRCRIQMTPLRHRAKKRNGELLS